MVWVVAREDAAGLRAERVAVQQAARGPIQRVVPGRRRIRVAGRWVTLLDEVLVVDESSGLQLDPRGLRVGEMVAVSGLEDADRRIFATRIDRLEQAGASRAGLPDVAELARAHGVAELSVEGFVSRADDATLRLGSLSVELPGGATGAPRLEPDTRVWVQGRSTARALRAERIALPPARMRAPVAPPLPILRDVPRAGSPRPPEPGTGRPAVVRDPSTPPPPAPAPQPRPEPGEGPIRIQPDVDRITPAPTDARGVLTR